MCNKCNSMSTFILGALIGAAIGVLYAPAKGETTRKKVKKWVKETYEDGKDELMDRTHELREKLSVQTAAAKEKAEELKELTAEKAEELKERLNEKAAEIKLQAQEKIDVLRAKAADQLEKAAKKLR